MRTVRLTLAYDGTDFSGWQRQSGSVPGRGRRSVQECVETALAAMHKHPVPLTGAGRTDAGVHAVGQVANFCTDIDNIDTGRFVPALNSLLPGDIRVTEARETIPDFHARFDASSRTYRYRFVCARQILPHESRYALHLRRRPNVALLNRYCRHLLGEHDFSTFAAAGDSSKSKVRHVTKAVFYPESDSLIFEISANAFLWKMVRSVAGTLLHRESLATPPEALRRALEAGNRKLAGPTLPPQGLFLWKVDYYRG